MRIFGLGTDRSFGTAKLELLKSHASIQSPTATVAFIIQPIGNPL